MDLLITEIDGWSPKHIEPFDEPEELNKVFKKHVKRKGRSYVPLHTQGRPSLPYKIDAEEGTYYAPNLSDPYAFTALAIKGESLDLQRLYKETELIAARDYEMFKNLVEPRTDLDHKQKVQLMVSLHLLQFRGDEDRYNGTVQEAKENLFYWHLAQKFYNTTVIYGIKGKAKNDLGKNLYGDQRLSSMIELGRTVQEILSNIEDNQWAILFGTYEE